MCVRVNQIGSSNLLESTSISGSSTTVLGKELSRIHSKISEVKGERSLLDSFKKITSMCERIGVSKVVVDTAKQVFKKVDDEKILKGKPTESWMAACIYLACVSFRYSYYIHRIPCLNLPIYLYIIFFGICVDVERTKSDSNFQRDLRTHKCR
jgi:hypothetical protein